MMMTGRWDSSAWTLAATTAGLALALFMLTDYEGAGRFVVQLPWPSLPAAGAAAALPASAGSAQPIPRPTLSRPGKDQASRSCAAIRDRLAAALRRYRTETRKPIRSLDIFALLAARVIDELPACPSGGAFRLDSAADATVACTLH